MTNPAANSLGIHAGLSDFAESNEFHVVLYDRVGTLRRSLRFDFLLATRGESTNPIANTVYPINSNTLSRIIYLERPDSGGASVWASLTGNITITDVTPTTYTVTLSNTEMRATPTSTDAFNIRGSIVIQKNQVVTEVDSIFHCHQDGVDAAQNRWQTGASAH